VPTTEVATLKRVASYLAVGFAVDSKFRRWLPLDWLGHWFSLLDHEHVESFCGRVSLVICFVNDAGLIVVGLPSGIGLSFSAFLSTDDLTFEDGSVFVAGMRMK
jgi:hypothetical protein